MTAINALLSTLDDPFNMFPLQSVAQHLTDLVDASDESTAGRAGWWGVSPKYRSVEDEHDIEVVRLLIGSAFVLGQAAITQTVSIATRLRSLAGDPSWLPNGKTSILTTNATIHATTGISEIALIDAVANYFKHHYEWPADWAGASRAQQRTIDVVLKLGLVPNGEDNLRIALHQLGMSANDMSPLGRVIQEWRERIAASFRNQMDNHGIQ
jgi:hypothetical protein